MSDTGWNVEVVAWVRYRFLLEPFARPDLDLLAPDEIEGRFVVFMQMSLCPATGRDHDRSQPQALRSHTLGAHTRRVCEPLLAAITVTGGDDLSKFRVSRCFHGCSPRPQQSGRRDRTLGTSHPLQHASDVHTGRTGPV